MRQVIFVLVFSALAFSAAQSQQTILLRNGDRVSGSLTGIDGGHWVFAHAGGELKIPAAEIASFTSGGPIGVRLADGTILAASVTPSGGQLRLSAADGTPRTVAPADFAAVGDPTSLEKLEPIRIGYFSPLGRFWRATASAGFANKTGNSRNRGLTAELTVGRRTVRDRLRFRVGVAREESLDPTGDTLATTVEKYYGSARADVFFGPRVFAFGSTQQERDTFQDIDLRSNYNAGLGIQVISADLTDLRFYASGGLRREAFTSGESESTPIVAAGIALQQQLGPAALDWSVDWSPSVEDLQDYRFISEAALSTTLIAGLGFRIASRNEVNNQPRPDIEKHDWLLTTALTYTIGQ